MVDTVSRGKRSEIMSKIRGKHTGPEITLRKALRKAGYSYKLHYGKHKIDIAFPDRRVAVFVDGCFWHKCPKHFRLPKSNTAFWRKKIGGNARRDPRERAALRREGWRVMRVWEHDLRGAAFPRAISRISRALSR